jgi:hypothetical protein
MHIFKSTAILLMAVFHISLASAQLRMQHCYFSISDQD